LILALGLSGNGLLRTYAADPPDDSPDAVTEQKAPAAESDDSAKDTNGEPNGKKHRKGIHHQAIVVMGHNVELKAEDIAEAVVVIGGNAIIHGKVDEAVVVIGGDLTADGEIGDAAVAVMGNLNLRKGAEIHGNVVTVGGKLDRADEVTVDGNPVEVDPLGLGQPLRAWFFQCVLKLRPLAPQVGWVWLFAGLFFLLYFLVALILPRPVQACVAELTRRPITTFFLGILTKILVPLVILILIATGVGVFVAPFAVAALLFGVILGKVALMEFIGTGIGRRFGINIMPLGGFLLGILLITLLYMVPLVGLITWAVVSLWGLGGVVTATFSGLRREMPEKPPLPAPTMPTSPPPPPSPTAAPTPQPANPDPLATAPEGAPAPQPGAPSMTMPSSASTMATMPAVPDVLAYPKAGFWERMAAAFLDFLLVGVVAGFTGRAPLGFLLILAYFVAMWVWKGTTVGGVVLGLKVARIDGQPLTLTVALVRALAGAFSVMVFFLGILWIAWDRDKQGWHDRIAGTVVLRMPRGTPLVLF
jgi:uncharacterized RDD family membrane protein YckC